MSLIGQQVDSLSNVDIEEILIKSSRIISPLHTLPLSVSIQDSLLQKDAYQKTSLQEFLGAHPGVFSMNANNYAQDLRISIRGFGARSPFGIRGVKLIVDGIPETTPDGQGQIDNLILDNIQSIEILKGPSSGLYGNASGGVIKLNSEFDYLKSGIISNTQFGSYGNFRQAIKGVWQKKSSTLIASALHNQLDGYRTHSANETNIGSLKYQYNSPGKLKLRFISNFTHSPIAQDPGSLTLADADEIRDQARQRNVDFGSGESINHFKIGNSLEYILGNKKIESQSYFHKRQFDGKLPFTNGGIIDLNRNFFGHSSQIIFHQDFVSSRNKILFGYDAQFQNDDRQRFVNNMSVRTDETLNQNEIFRNLALFLVDHFNVKEKLTVNLDLRYDNNVLRVEDDFLSDGDDSSKITYNSFNYGIGIGYNPKKNLFTYLRLSSSFETPTLSELSANPQGGGFNQALKPLESTNYEIGIKQYVSTKLKYQLALFNINTKNELLPFELADFPGRDFFLNAGKTKRTGLEFSGHLLYSNSLALNLTYNFSVFNFDEFETGADDFSNNTLPGLPRHYGSFDLIYQFGENTSLNFLTHYTGKLFADNANSVQIDDFFRSDIKLSQTLDLQKLTAKLYLGINNILDVQYFDNIRINAFGRRYYEAAPERNFYVGVKFRILE